MVNNNIKNGARMYQISHRCRAAHGSLSVKLIFLWGHHQMLLPRRRRRNVPKILYTKEEEEVKKETAMSSKLIWKKNILLNAYLAANHTI